MPTALVLPRPFPERLAVEWGHDEYGIFMGFGVGHVEQRIVQRMRWIAPGSFLMGSPENEVGRDDDEVQHRVELTQGYWLADTPVTQALWEAVMGTTPSRFEGSNNPVEQVSWDDCQAFLRRLNERVEGLHARLPTEAEWEYACRAGTKTATWVGDLENEFKDPRLDPIAWYYPNADRSTHAVAQKQANPWGASTTCSATCANGVPIGTMGTASRRCKIHKALRWAPVESYAAAVGATARGM